MKVIARVPGLTFRQLDYWSRRGYLRPQGVGGSGYARHWPDEEVRVAALMLRLVNVGLSPARASAVARQVGPDGGEVTLGPGVVLALTHPR